MQTNSLSKITRESEKQQHRKTNAVLKNYDSNLIGNDIRCRIQCNHRCLEDGNTHSITLSKYDNLTEEQHIAISKQVIFTFFD